MRSRPLRWAMAWAGLLAGALGPGLPARASVSVLVIQGRGYGHGVGLAQDGAYWMGVGGAGAAFAGPWPFSALDPWHHHDDQAIGDVTDHPGPIGSPGPRQPARRRCARRDLDRAVVDGAGVRPDVGAAGDEPSVPGSAGVHRRRRPPQGGEPPGCRGLPAGHGRGAGPGLAVRLPAGPGGGVANLRP